MKKLIMLTGLLMLVGCNKYTHNGTPNEPLPPVVITPEPLTIEQDIAALVAEENEHRVMLGQSVLSRGLSCTVSKFVSPSNPTTIYATTNNTNKVGTTTTAFSFTLDSVINQVDSPVENGMSVLPVQFRSNPIYQSWYLLRCSGHLVVTKTDYYNFSLESDDGSILSLDGVKLIDNDGSHATLSKSVTKLLRRGVHSFKLEYLQGQGSQSLILKAGGELIDPMYLVH